MKWILDAGVVPSVGTSFMGLLLNGREADCDVRRHQGAGPDHSLRRPASLIARAGR